tara:strand:- start:13120 stop:13950 length:831 start_codon:yes stop_codon:yes gene_type:complete
MAHNEPKVLELLLSLIDDERNHIYIHLDAKSKTLNKNEIYKWCNLSTIKFISSNNVYWSGYSQIKVSLNLLKKAVLDEHTYYHFLSGVDLPLKTQDELHSFFIENEGQEFVSFGKINTWKLSSRYKYYYPEKITKYINRDTYRILRLFIAGIQSLIGINRSRRSDLEYHMGGNWFSITHNFAAHLTNKEIFIQKNFKNTFCSDEIFLPTMAMNSPYKKNVSKMMNLRYVDWERGKPYMWQEQDFKELTTQNIFFARKFSYEMHPDILELIKKHLID